MIHNKITLQQRIIKIFLILTLLTILATPLAAQHRGDPLAFQGLSNSVDYTAKSIAMGNAFTSLSRDLGSLYFNPAGLASISRIKVSVSANSQQKKWFENQDYRSNRFQVHLPFYLEGLYTPGELNIDTLTGEPAWDNEIAIDSNYVVREPEMGKGKFSEDGADWVEDVNTFTVNTLALALPMTLLDKNVVLSVGYKNRYNVTDFDRNDTYLDPHLGYSKYDMPQRVADGDTLKVNWYRYLRDRSGNLHQGKIAVGVEMTKNLKLGLGLTMMTGETEDMQYLNKYGYFDIVNNNRFRFGFDTLDTRVEGKSTLQSFAFNIGAIYSIEKLSVGINLDIPHTITREYDYTKTTVTGEKSVSQKFSGTDELELPLAMTVGVNFQPIEKFIFSVDYHANNYSKATFKLADAMADSAHNAWVDQRSWHCGIEYKILPYLSLMGGYQHIPQAFVPDGAAFEDRGPQAESYSLGAGMDFFNLGRITVAYKMNKLKYYDQYMSNTNYNVIKYNNLSIGYELSL